MIHMTAQEPLDPYLSEAWSRDTVVDVLLPDGQRAYIVPESRLDSLVETARVLRDPAAVDAIGAGLRDLEAGDIVSTDEVRQALLKTR
ncbi:MAG: hypothetical protein ACR2JX_04875 [Mycobacteriales bacterium]